MERISGVVEPSRIAKPQDETRKLETLRRVWSEARQLQPGDDVMRYFAGRGLIIDHPPAALRLHPAFQYHDHGQVLGTFPALVALVTGPDGNAVTLHRTYLQNGRKAPVPSPKKLMPGHSIKGAAIRLHEAGEVLGVAEGIETALAAFLRFGVPTWACVSAHGIETFLPPTGVKKIVVFGDNDASGTGQAAAWALAKRAISTGIEVEVKIPEKAGTDWAGTLCAQ